MRPRRVRAKSQPISKILLLSEELESSCPILPGQCGHETSTTVNQGYFSRSVLETANYRWFRPILSLAGYSRRTPVSESIEKYSRRLWMRAGAGPCFLSNKEE